MSYQHPGSSYQPLLFFGTYIRSVQVEMLMSQDCQWLRRLKRTINLIHFLPQVQILPQQWPPKLSLSKKHLRACHGAGFGVLNLPLDPLYRTAAQLVLWRGILDTFRSQKMGRVPAAMQPLMPAVGLYRAYVRDSLAWPSVCFSKPYAFLRKRYTRTSQDDWMCYRTY